MSLPACDWASSGFGFTPADAARIDRFGSTIVDAAGAAGIPDEAAILLAIAWVESRFVEDATSKAGAMGLMQLMPATYDSMRDALGLGTNAFDPRDNIIAGVGYYMLLRNASALQVQAIAGYFAGSGNVERNGWQRYRSYVTAVTDASRRFAGALQWCEGTGPKGTMRAPPRSKGRGVPSSPSSSDGGLSFFAIAAAAALALLG